MGLYNPNLKELFQKGGLWSAAIGALLLGLMNFLGYNCDQIQPDPEPANQGAQIHTLADLPDPYCLYVFQVRGNVSWQKQQKVNDTKGLSGKRTVDTDGPGSLYYETVGPVKINVAKDAPPIYDQVKPHFLKVIASKYGDSFTYTVADKDFAVFVRGKPICPDNPKEEQQPQKPKDEKQTTEKG